jgi:exosortase
MPDSGESQWDWPALAWCGVCFGVGFGPVLAGLALLWFQDGDMSHGAVAPLVAGWIAWQRRGRLRGLEPRPSGWGLALMALAMIGVAIGLPSGWHSFARTSLLLSLAGLILYLRGAATLRLLAFPLLLLSFMVPPPTFLYEEITLPLQLLASRLAESALEFLGFSVLRDGNILELAGQKLSVAEACSGIRSLFSLCFFALVYAYLFDARPWMRGVLLAAAVPIAILANAARIVFTGVVGEHNPGLAHGALHGISGWAVFLLAVLLMAALHQVLSCSTRHQRVVVTE